MSIEELKVFLTEEIAKERNWLNSLDYVNRKANPYKVAKVNGMVEAYENVLEKINSNLLNL